MYSLDQGTKMKGKLQQHDKDLNIDWAPFYDYVFYLFIKDNPTSFKKFNLTSL